MGAVLFALSAANGKFIISLFDSLADVLKFLFGNFNAATIFKPIILDAVKLTLVGGIKARRTT